MDIEHYRHLVIANIEVLFNVELQQVGNRPKWQKDKSGRNWWVLISSTCWCGIPIEMVNDELERPIEGILVIALLKHATLKRTAIDAYKGSAQQFCSAKDKFSRGGGSENQYQFNCEVVGQKMRIKKEPTITLNKFLSVTHSSLKNGL